MTNIEKEELQTLLDHMDYMRAEYNELSERHEKYYKQLVAAMSLGTHINIPDPYASDKNSTARVNAVTTGTASFFRLGDMHRTGFAVVLADRDETTNVHLCDIKAGWLEDNPSTCLWEMTESGDKDWWRTGCGHSILSSDIDMFEIGVLFCCKCGKEIVFPEDK